MTAAARREALRSCRNRSAIPPNEMPRYHFWERKRIKAAEGKLRAFRQTGQGCLHWRRASTSTGAASHTSGCGPGLGPGASSEPGRRTGSGSGWGSGLWGAGKAPSVSYLSDKEAGVKHQARAQSLFQMHIRGSGSRAGHGFPSPGLVALPGGAPCQGAERRGLGWHLRG